MAKSVVDLFCLTNYDRLHFVQVELVGVECVNSLVKSSAMNAVAWDLTNSEMECSCYVIYYEQANAMKCQGSILEAQGFALILLS